MFSEEKKKKKENNQPEVWFNLPWIVLKKPKVIELGAWRVNDFHQGKEGWVFYCSNGQTWIVGSIQNTIDEVEYTSYKCHHYKFLELHMTNGLSCKNKWGSTFDKLKKILVDEPWKQGCISST